MSTSPPQNSKWSICTSARTFMEPHIGLPMKSSCSCPPDEISHANPHETLHGSLQGNSPQHTESCSKASSGLPHEVLMQLPHGSSHVSPHEDLHGSLYGSLHGSLQGNSPKHTESCSRASPELPQSPSEFPSASHSFPKLLHSFRASSELPRASQELPKDPQSFPRAPQNFPRAPQSFPLAPPELPQKL